MVILAAENVTKSYAEQRVLCKINLQVEDKKIYLIKGRSGCGKSTLLNICSFLEKPDSGSIYYKGTLINNMSEEKKKELLRKEIGYIFQDYNLFEEFSVYDNLYIYLTTTTDLSKSEIDRKIQEGLKQLELTHKIKDKAKFLSGGERQRLTLARTLLLPRNIIFADEPSANIDNQSISVMLDIFKQLRSQGTSILIVSHDELFDEIADTVLRLEAGELR